MRVVVPAETDAVESVGDYGRIYYVAAPSPPLCDRSRRVLLPHAYLRASAKLRKILSDEQPDLIEICDKYSLCHLAALVRRGLATVAKRPVLVGLSCERTDDEVAAYFGAGRTRRALTRAYVRHVYGPSFDAHIANSEYTAAELRRNLWDYATDFVRVCPMGVESTAFGPVHRDSELRGRLLAQAGGTRESVLLLYVGCVSPEQNLRLLIETLERLVRPTRFRGDGERDYRLVIAGDGPSVNALKAEAPHYVARRVLWLGAIDDRVELARLYASADVFVHPNPREPFGMGPLEAMASRVPLVVPAEGGVLSYATHENAWLAAPDAHSFALAIRTAVSSPDPDRTAAAFATARSLDWSSVSRRYLKLYDELHRRHSCKVALPISLRRAVVTS